MEIWWNNNERKRRLKRGIWLHFAPEEFLVQICRFLGGYSNIDKKKEGEVSPSLQPATRSSATPSSGGVPPQRPPFFIPTESFSERSERNFKPLQKHTHIMRKRNFLFKLSHVAIYDFVAVFYAVFFQKRI